MIDNEEIRETLNRIVNSLVDCLQSMRLLEPILFHSDVMKIDKTNIANATLVIRDALIHRAVLAIVRIYDFNNNSKNNKDRASFDMLFQLLDSNEIQIDDFINIKNEYTKIKELPEFKELKKVRDSRIAHQLNDSGASLSYDMLKNIAIPTRKIVNKLLLQIYDTEFFSIGFEKFWVETSKDFWSCVFNKSLKDAKQFNKLPVI